MNEVKKPKKPMIFYYCIVLAVLLLFNFLIMPSLQQLRIREIDYGTFLTMIENKEIGEVQVEDNRILFTDKEGKIVYKTGKMDDPALTERLHKAGIKFSSEIVEEMSPLLNFILTWILPIVVFFAIGQF